MKNLILLLFVFLSITATFGQKKKKGVIKYSVSAVAQDTTFDAKMSEALLNKSEFSFMFKGKNKARVQLQAGSFFNFVTVFDYKKGVYLRLIGDQKNKSAQVGDIVPLTDSLKNLASTYTLLEDTMTILGFKCKKAIFESDFGTLECWYTDELDHNFRKLEFIDVDVPGLPLMFMTTSGRVTLTYKAVSFEKLSKEYKALLSTEIPEGYQTAPEQPEAN